MDYGLRKIRLSPSKRSSFAAKVKPTNSNIPSINKNYLYDSSNIVLIGIFLQKAEKVCDQQRRRILCNQLIADD